MADGLIPSSGSMVETRMANLLTKGNPYLDVARNRSQEAMSGRGLINSSIAAGAGERAAIEAALPIAAQDAATQAGAETETFRTTAQRERDILLHGQTGELSAQEAAQQEKLTAQKGDISSRLQTEGGDISSRLQTEGAAQKGALSAQEATQTLGLSAQEAAQRAGLSAQEADQARERQLEASQQALAMEEYTQGMVNTRFQAELLQKTNDMEAGDKRAFTNATGPMFQQALTEKTKINQIPDSEMDATAKAVEMAAIEQNLIRDVNFLASLYGYPIYWEQPEKRYFDDEAPNTAQATNTAPTTGASPPVDRYWDDIR